MFPEESLTAAKDAGVKKAMPVHVAGFALAQHHWTEPVEKFLKHSEEKNLDIALARIGQLFSMHEDLSSQKWW